MDTKNNMCTPVDVMDTNQPLKTRESNGTDRRPRNDPVSGEPYASLSIAVRYFYPDTDWYRMYHKNTEFLSKIGLLTGSAIEDLNLPVLEDTVNNQQLKNDVDLLILLDFSQVIPVAGTFRLIDNKERPGFCHIAFTTNQNTSELEQYLHRRDGNLYIKNNIFSRDFIPSYEKGAHKLFLSRSVPITSENCDEIGTSPAYTFSGNLPTGLSADNVPCFPVSWPEEAKAWGDKSREYSWPTAKTIREVLDTSCHLVSKAHPLSTCPEIDWRYSFSMAERVLAKSLGQMQKVSYKVFKTLIRYDPKTSGLNIQSYFLKTTLFWAVEQSASSSWDLDGLGEKFLFLFDKLLDFLRKHELPHFFIPSNNIITQFSQEEVKKWIDGVESLRNNPLQCMRDFHSRHQMKYLGFKAPSENVSIGFFYQAGLDILRERPNTLGTLATNIEKSLEYFGFPYASMCCHEMAMSIAMTEVIVDESSGIKLLCKKDEDLIEEEITVLIKTYRKYKELVPSLIKLLPDTQPEGTRSVRVRQKHVTTILQAEIACLFFQISQNDDIGADNSKVLCQEAERCFRDDYSSKVTRVNVQLQVKYAQFLVIQSRFTEAFQLLLKHLAAIKDSNLFVVYNRYTNKNVEPTLRIIHECEGGDIYYRASNMGHFLLAICCKEVFRNSVEIRRDFCQIWSIEQFQTMPNFQIIHEHSLFFDACLLLRYGKVHEALCILMKAKYDLWTVSLYKCYCVSVMVEMLTKSVMFLYPPVIPK